MTSITEQGQQVGVRGCWEGGAHFTGGVGIWLNSPLAPPQTHSDWHLAALELKKGEIKKSPQSEEGFGLPSSMEQRLLPSFHPVKPSDPKLPGCTPAPNCQRTSLCEQGPPPLPFFCLWTHVTWVWAVVGSVAPTAPLPLPTPPLRCWEGTINHEHKYE